MEFFSGFYELCFFRKESLERFQSTRRKSSWQPNQRPQLSRNLELVRIFNLALFRTLSTVVRPGIRSDSKSDLLKNDSFFCENYFMSEPGQDLPSFPAVPPDASVRTVEVSKPAENPWKEARSVYYTSSAYSTNLVRKTPCINLSSFTGKRQPKKQSQRRTRQRSSMRVTMRRTR